MQMLDEIRAADVLAQKSDVAKNAEDILASIEDPEARENAENLMKDFGSVPVKTEVASVDLLTEPPKVPTAPLPKSPTSKVEATPSNVIDITDKLAARAANSYRVRRINNFEARQSRRQARAELKNRSSKIETNVKVAKTQEAYDKADQDLQRAKEALSRNARKDRAKGIYDSRVDTLRTHFTKDGVLDEKRFGASLKGLERASKKAAKVQARSEYSQANRLYAARAEDLGKAEQNRRAEIRSLRWYRNTRFNILNRQGVRYNGYVKPVSSSGETSTTVDLEAARKAREAAEKRRRDAENARVAAKHKAAKNTPAIGKKPQSKPAPQTKPTPKAA